MAGDRRPLRLAERVWVPAFCVGLLALLILLARDSTTYSIVAIAVAALVAVVALLGLEKAGITFVLLGMVCAPMSGLVPVSSVTVVTFADVFFILGFGLLVPTIVTNRTSPPIMYVLGALIVVLVGAVTSLGADNPVTSFSLMSRLVVTALGFPLFFMLWRPGWRLTGYLAGGYVAGVVISAGYGLFFGGSTGENRYIGLSEHPNALGLTGLFGAFLVPFIVSVMPRSHRWFWWTLGLGNLAAIWLSGSRAALLVAVVVALLYPAIERSLKATGLLIVAGACALPVVQTLLNNNSTNLLDRLLGGGSASASDLAREQAIDIALTSFWQHPLLGKGFEGALDAHVIYLEVAVCVGVIGTIGYLFLLGSATYPILTAVRPYHRIAYPALCYMMVGLITNALWDRYIWAVLSLSFLAALPYRPDDEVPDAAPYGASTKEEVAP